MEAVDLFLGMGVVFAGGAGFLCLGLPAERIVSRFRELLSLHPEARRMAFERKVFSEGVRFLYPVASKLLLLPALHGFMSECMGIVRDRGHPGVRIQALTSSSIAVLSMFSLLVGFLLGSLFSGIAVGLAIAALAVFAVRSDCDKRTDRLRLCVPDSIQGMKSCFQAGFTLDQTLEYLANHTCEEMARVYGRALQSLRLGATTTEALDILRTEVNAPEFSFVIAALDIQHKTGGSLSSVLQDAEAAARGQFELERALRTQTAQARLSARVVSVMPLVLVGMFSLVTEGFLEPFFSSIAGFLLLLLALGMQVAGVIAVRKTLCVKGVSA